MIPIELQTGFTLCFDTETAQLGDHVVEIGMSVYNGQNLISEWGTFVRPVVPIDPGAAAVHHITENQVKDAPCFAQVATKIRDMLSFATTIVAYNYDYDREVLGKEFARCGLTWPDKPMVDPFVLYKKFFKFNKGKKLINAAENFGFRYVGAHRAVNDATMTGKVLLRMAAIKPDFPKTMKELMTKQRMWVEAQFTEYYNYCQRSGKKLPTPPQFKYYDPVLTP